MAGILRFLLCSVGAIAMQACTIVEIQDGSVAPSLHFGVLRIQPAGAPTATVYRSSGIGIVPGRNGVTFGAADETAAIIFAADDCRVILFQPREAEVAALRATLAAAGADADTLCIAGEKKR